MLSATRRSRILQQLTVWQARVPTTWSQSREHRFIQACQDEWQHLAVGYAELVPLKRPGGKPGLYSEVPAPERFQGENSDTQKVKTDCHILKGNEKNISYSRTTSRSVWLELRPGRVLGNGAGAGNRD